MRSANSWAELCFGRGTTGIVIPYALMNVEMILCFTVGIKPCSVSVTPISHFIVQPVHWVAFVWDTVECWILYLGQRLAISLALSIALLLLMYGRMLCLMFVLS